MDQERRYCYTCGGVISRGQLQRGEFQMIEGRIYDIRCGKRIMTTPTVVRATAPVAREVRSWPYDGKERRAGYLTRVLDDPTAEQTAPLYEDLDE